jgi:hypothetical protein
LGGGKLLNWLGLLPVGHVASLSLKGI